MPLSRRRSVTRLSSVVLATGALMIAAPVLARPDLTEDQVPATAGRQVIHLRIQTGCGDAATDRVELGIPESVIGVIAEAKPGWSVETVTEPTDPYDLFGTRQTDRVSTVRWTGGSVPSDQFLDFAIAAVFTEQGQLAFPVTQGCGADEVSFTRVPDPGQEGKDPEDAATIDVVAEPPAIDLAALKTTVDELGTQVTDLKTKLDDVPIDKLRDRIGALEDRVAELEALLSVASPSPGGG